MYGNIAKMNNEILSQSSFYEKSIKFKNNKVDDKRLNFYFFNKPQLSMLPQTGIDFFNYYKGMGYCVGCDETFKINKVYLQPSNDLSSILAIKSDNFTHYTKQIIDLKSFLDQCKNIYAMMGLKYQKNMTL
jgi:hypothetical protein